MQSTQISSACAFPVVHSQHSDLHEIIKIFELVNCFDFRRFAGTKDTATNGHFDISAMPTPPALLASDCLCRTVRKHQLNKKKLIPEVNAEIP